MTNEELTRKYVALDEMVMRQAEQIRTAFHQIGEAKSIAESVHKLATSVELLAREQCLTNEKVDALASDMEEVKEKPGRRWETIVSVAITAVVTALLAFALAQLGVT